MNRIHFGEETKKQLISANCPGCRATHGAFHTYVASHMDIPINEAYEVLTEPQVEPQFPEWDQQTGPITNVHRDNNVDKKMIL